MMALGVGVMWAGYALAIWGYCLVRGYDVTFAAMFRPKWPGPAATPSGTLPLPVDSGIGTSTA